MIRRPAGWICERRPDRWLLTSQLSTGRARLRYFEKLRPLERLGDLIERHASALGVPTTHEREGPVEAFATAEGEYGAIVHLTVRGDIAWSLAFVFGDDFYSCIEAETVSACAPQLRETIRELVLGEELRLGVRQRRYLYRPPAWQAVSIGELIAHYFPTNYPDVGARLSVYPAVPLIPGRQPIVDLQRVFGEHLVVDTVSQASGFEVTECEPAAPVISKSGMFGTRWKYTGTWERIQRVVRDIVLLRDDVYVYAAELCSSPPDHNNLVRHFEAVVDSIEPLPRMEKRKMDLDLFSYLAE